MDFEERAASLNRYHRSLICLHAPACILTLNVTPLLRLRRTSAWTYSATAKLVQLHFQSRRVLCRPLSVFAQSTSQSGGPISLPEDLLT